MQCSCEWFLNQVRRPVHRPTQGKGRAGNDAARNGWGQSFSPISIWRFIVHLHSSPVNGDATAGTRGASGHFQLSGDPVKEFRLGCVFVYGSLSFDPDAPDFIGLVRPNDMSQVPDTRVSLILRLRNRDDVAAWHHFVSLYEPVIYRVARRRGWQHEDARDLVQDVLMAVARAVGSWDPTGSGRFRSWLFRVLQNRLVDQFRRRGSLATAMGGSSMALRIQQHADPQEHLSAEIEQEYRRQVFLRAADQVRQQVQSTTWQAFWRTSVDGESVEDTARELEMTVGAVYIARSRVLARLRQLVQHLDQPERR
jgi:RNA polymerase sigma-70 factor (ECF subfamily)